jgi:hypothetical protein
MRLRSVALVAAIALPLVAAIAIVVGTRVDADLENNNSVFTSRGGLRLIVPRGWRASDQPSYPGVVLWMMRSQPEGQIALTAETFTHDLYCSWPVACRTSHDPLPTKYACAIRARLAQEHFRVGPTQPGPKENESVGLPSVWFEFDDGKHFLRQAVAMTADHAYSLVLTTTTNDARSAHGRAFEQALRTLQVLSPSSTAPDDAAAPDTAPLDGAPSDAATALTDATAVDGGVMFESAPAPKINPVGPCL